MSLPATDNFNRADGAPGANWSGGPGGDLAINTNRITGATTGDNSMYWSADAPNAAQYAQIVMSSIGSGWQGPCVRASATDWVTLDANEQNHNWLIEWYNGNNFTQIGSTYSGAPANGDVAKITADGSTFKGYVNGTERISGTNASAPSTGSGGLYIYWTANGLDDFEVGNLAAAARAGLIIGGRTLAGLTLGGLLQ